jgi:hypothetical protein
LHELHVIVENIVRERCETSEVHLPAPTSQHKTDVHPCEVEVTNISNTSILSGETSDCKGLVSSTSSPILNAIKELAEELDVVGKSQVAEPSVVVVVDSFAEVSQMAEEVVIDATQ